MPELPDVTVYIEALEERVLNQTILRVRIASPFVVRSFDPPIREAERKTIAGLRRVGRRIGLELGGELVLGFRLMIAGRLHWKPRNAKIARRYGLAAFDFENGT